MIEINSLLKACGIHLFEMRILEKITPLFIFHACDFSIQVIMILSLEYLILHVCNTPAIVYLYLFTRIQDILSRVDVFIFHSHTLYTL